MPDHPAPAPARDLTPDEQEARHQTCAALDQRVKASIRKGREALWALAETLYEFDEESGWLALGFDSLADWLDQPEVGLKKSAYYNAVARWREVVVRRQVDSSRLESLDPAKVDEVLPAIKRGQALLPAALDDVQTKTLRELREQYATPNGDKPKMPEPVEKPPEKEPVEKPAEGEQSLDRQIEARKQIIETQRTRPSERTHDHELDAAVARVEGALAWNEPLQRATKNLLAVLATHREGCGM